MKYKLRLLNADEISVLSKRKLEITEYARHMTDEILESEDFRVLLNKDMVYVTKGEFLDGAKEKCVVLPCLDYPDLDQLKNVPKTIQLGEYPQEIASPLTSYLLEENYQNRRLEATGFSYAFFARSEDGDHKEIKLNRAVVYYFRGEKYIRASLPVNTGMIASEYEFFMVDWKSPVWYKVSPVEWIVEKERKMLVSRYGLMSGLGISTKVSIAFVPTTMTNDMFASHILEEAKNKELEKRESSVDEDLAFIKERLKLSYGASPELKDLLYPALERTDQVAYKIKNSYQKIK